MVLERNQLKEVLLEIKNNDYIVPEQYTPFTIGCSMMAHIGDTDPILRDELIYEVLEYFTVNDVFTPGELREFLDIAFDDMHLFFKIGKLHDDSVFTRTFSLLFIAAVLFRHNRNAFLTKEQVVSYFNRITDYIKQEVDVRGYIETKGWAHSVAHTADVLTQFASCDELDTLHYKEVLNSVSKMIANNTYTFIHQEDERAVTTLLTIIKKNKLPLLDWSQWISHLTDIGTVKTFPTDLTIHLNIKHLLRSLYFRLIDQSAYEDILVLVKEGLSKISRFN